MLGELIGTLVKVATDYLIISTADGKKKIPYKEINISYGGLTLQELLRKRVKITLWDKVTIEISSPKD
jgi:hypothetical protein